MFFFWVLYILWKYTAVLTKREVVNNFYLRNIFIYFLLTFIFFKWKHFLKIVSNTYFIILPVRSFKKFHYNPIIKVSNKKHNFLNLIYIFFILQIKCCSELLKLSNKIHRILKNLFWNKILLILKSFLLFIVCSLNWTYKSFQREKIILWSLLDYF